jgi:ABC-2 type transport system permease protein
MFKLIITYEGKLFKQSYIMLAALLLYALIGWMSVENGFHRYHYQQQAIDSVRVSEQKSKAKLQASFDTIKFTPGKRDALEDPYMLDYSSNTFAIKSPSPLAVFSIGQNDVYPFIRQAWMGSEIFSNSYEEFHNPEQLLAGNLDFTYFLLFIFPLLLIAFTYNIVAADKEKGIDKLLIVESGKPYRIMLYRLLFRWGIILLLTFLLFAAGIFRLRNCPDMNAAAVTAWAFSILLYGLFWLMIISAIIRRGWNSVLSAVSLAGCWIALLVAVPGISNAWLQLKHPGSLKEETTQLREFTYAIWDYPTSKHSAYFYHHFPHLKTGTIKTDTTDMKMYSYVSLSDSMQRVLYEKMNAGNLRKMKTERNMYWFNPVAGVLHYITNISKSSIEQQFQYEASLIAYRKERIKTMYDAYFNLPNITKDVYEKLPALQIHTTPAPKNVFNLLPVMVWLLLFFLLNIIPVKKK